MPSVTNEKSDFDRAIFDLVPLPMWIYDLDTLHFLAVNKEAIHQYGYSEEEFKQMTIRDIRPQEDVPKLEEAVERTKSRRTKFKKSIFRHQRRDGIIMYVQIKGNTINFKGKKAEIVTATDLTELYEKERNLNKAYEELSFSEKRYRSLIGNGRDLVAIIDLAGNYKYVAPTSTTVLGIEPEAFLGKNAFDFIYEEDAPRVMEQLGKMQESKSVSIEAYRFPDVNGDLRWFKTELSNHLNIPLIEGIIANTHEVTAEIKEKIVSDLFTELTLTFAKSFSLVSSLDKALQRLVLLPKIRVSEIWLVAPDHSELHLVSTSLQQRKFDLFYQHTQEFTSCTEGEGLAGSVWKEKKVIVWDNLVQNKHFLRAEAAQMTGLSTGIGLPIMYGDEFLGCIVCFSTSPPEILAEKITLLTHLSEKLGPIVKQKVTEEEYRNVFNISSDPLCIVGFDGYIKKCNKAFAHLMGYQKSHLYATAIFDFICLDDRSRAAEALSLLISGHLTERFSGRFLTAQGEIKWLQWSATVAAESKTIVAVGKDITKQKLAEQALQTAYEKLKTAQKIAKLGYWFRPIDSDISEWSEEVYTIYDCSPDTFIPTVENVKQALLPNDRHLMEEDPSVHLQPGTTKSFEHKIVTRSGRLKWVHQEVLLVTDEQGNVVKIEGTIQDITASRQAMDQIKKQNDTLREIAWLQSHSIRAPLTRIMSLIYLSKELDGGGKSPDEIMDLIMDSAQELDDVIAQITVKTNLIHHEHGTDTTHR
ncbi:PAS domain S-box protein [Sphingobacterium sp. 2149]|uniref:PAS domain S-box protein n=1 Tax=Sphingobacterium sp. 2149 TaxID=2817763 RepID=UPI001AE3FA7F|nr:PAS domain S-box protein [Sphingobacterium sp. 2149]MDR6733775.1 PAS domain S-box-containing protein [Sphingobacterium sp. 2149]